MAEANQLTLKKKFKIYCMKYMQQRERERERERDWDRDTEGERQTETQRERDRQRQTEGGRERGELTPYFEFSILDTTYFL